MRRLKRISTRYPVVDARRSGVTVVVVETASGAESGLVAQHPPPSPDISRIARSGSPQQGLLANPGVSGRTSGGCGRPGVVGGRVAPWLLQWPGPPTVCAGGRVSARDSEFPPLPAHCQPSIIDPGKGAPRRTPPERPPISNPSPRSPRRAAPIIDISQQQTLVVVRRTSPPSVSTSQFRISNLHLQTRASPRLN